MHFLLKFSLILILLLPFDCAFARIIHQEQSLYRNIIVTQSQRKRCMKFSFRKDHSQNQSCLLLNHPRKLVFDYARLATVGALANPDAKSILIIGLGGGTLIQAYHDLLPQANITTVEIDPAVVKVANEFFYLPQTNWNKLVTKDGRLFVKRALLKKKRFDIIILDAFNGDYIPEHLMTREFFLEVKSLLNSKGIVVANTFSGSRLYNNESVTYASVFGNFVELKGQYSGNRIILTAANITFNKNQLMENFKRFVNQFKAMGVSKDYLSEALDFNPQWDKSARLLTDDYAPVNVLK